MFCCEECVLMSYYFARQLSEEPISLRASKILPIRLLKKEDLEGSSDSMQKNQTDENIADHVRDLVQMFQQRVAVSDDKMMVTERHKPKHEMQKTNMTTIGSIEGYTPRIG